MNAITALCFLASALLVNGGHLYGGHLLAPAVPGLHQHAAGLAKHAAEVHAQQAVTAGHAVTGVHAVPAGIYAHAPAAIGLGYGIHAGVHPAVPGLAKHKAEVHSQQAVTAVHAATGTHSVAPNGLVGHAQGVPGLGLHAAGLAKHAAEVNAQQAVTAGHAVTGVHATPGGVYGLGYGLGLGHGVYGLGYGLGHGYGLAHGYGLGLGYGLGYGYGW